MKPNTPNEPRLATIISIYSAGIASESFATAILPRGELQSNFSLPLHLAVTIAKLAGDLTRAARR